MCGRVYIYDPQGEMICSFGGLGSSNGMFQQPSVLESINSKIFVLDTKLNRITFFSQTEYGENYMMAISLYNKTDYDGSIEYWEKVLKQNGNCLGAYRGIGKAMYGRGNYKAAMEYFKIADEREDYSAAYALYRKSIFRKLIVPVLILLFIFTVFVLWPRKNKTFVSRTVDITYKPVWYKVRTCVFHPIDNYSVLLRTTAFKSKIILSSIILAGWFVVSIVDFQFKGFIFNNNSVDEFNIINIFASTVVIFAAFCVSNWLFATMMSGGGKTIDIISVTAVSILPYVIGQILTVLLSNFLVSEEKVFLTVISVITVLWSVFLLLFGMQTIHEFSFKKTLFCMVMTIVGIFIMAFILLLAWSLFRQIYAFFSAIFEEISLMTAGG